MNAVVEILMRRDGLSEQEAIEQVKECRDVMTAEGNDGAIMEMLGLEPDYLFEVLDI